jgi:hypothetical protein
MVAQVSAYVLLGILKKIQIYHKLRRILIPLQQQITCFENHGGLSKYSFLTHHCAWERRLQAVEYNGNYIYHLLQC